MHGLMQDWTLTVDRILDHAASWHGRREIVTRTVEGPVARIGYAQLQQRARRLSDALLELGIAPGDRVATLAWNTQRHLEAWYAIMGIGAVCHTLNPRLHPDQIGWIANDAGDRLLLADISFAPMVPAIRALCPSIERVVFLTDRANMPAIDGALCVEELIEAEQGSCRWGGFDENSACGLCYTSGTTGQPKGVLYSHRSNMLHTMCVLQADGLGISASDVVLPVVPMYHANAWGIAFAAPMMGAKLVLPGPRLDGESLLDLIEREQVTFAAGVPTVWQILLQAAESAPQRLASLQRVLVGGAACSDAIFRAFDAHGIRAIHAWGMTETSPVGTVSAPTLDTPKTSEARLQLQRKQGRPPFGVDLALADDDGAAVARDGERSGHLKVRGPFVARRYFGGGHDVIDENGFFDTGDVATIDADGFVQITDRAKDLIKSGGEWISSQALENIAASHPHAERVAVIATPHPRWDERPLLLVQLRAGSAASEDEFLALFEGRVVKWWVPDGVRFVDEMPLGATGKIDKRALRAMCATT
ncbi:MAG: fatty-acyl-CoA synthase [Rhodospirillales bacterium]|nr:fatty-acyl-CoA synthase [Rhodospirillales bacterium]